ncbi:MAG: sialidase family protein [Planctomycetia bacterium]|nr:sialidase family protein [Planctomycetia bacterium]
MKNAIVWMVWGWCGLAAAGEPSEMLWEGTLPGKAAELPVLEGVQYVRVRERQPDVDGFRWLHGAVLSHYRGTFYASWGCNTGHENTVGEKIAMATSQDGVHWNAPKILLPDDRDIGRSHGVFWEHQGRFWALHAQFYGTWKKHVPFPNLGMELFLLEENGEWVSQGVVAKGIWPLQEPIRTASGDWVVAGVNDRFQACVARSEGDDPRKWTVTNITWEKGFFSETNLWADGDVLTLLLRNEHPQQNGRQVAGVAWSTDGGKTWSKAVESNLFMNVSKPGCRTLSNGQRLLAGFTAADAFNRNYLTLAVGSPGEKTLSHVWRLRSGGVEVPGGFPPKGFSYPAIYEWNEKIYVIYSVHDGGANQNHIELAIFPRSAIEVVP